MSIYLKARNSIRAVVRFLFLNKYREYKRQKYSDQLCENAVFLSSHCRELGSLESIVDYLLKDNHFAPTQINTEILALLNLLQKNRTSKILEIGGYQGGTLFLFSIIAEPQASILSIDLDYPPERILAFETFSTTQVQVFSLKADSHTTATKSKAQQHFNGELIDFLFIDGDHSYDGVKSDFEMYSQMVRPGGMIAFHDIVPDFKTRFNEQTPSNVGEVPKFWQEVKKDYSETFEFIADTEQDGFGIGAIKLPEESALT